MQRGRKEPIIIKPQVGGGEEGKKKGTQANLNQSHFGPPHRERRGKVSLLILRIEGGEKKGGEKR